MTEPNRADLGNTTQPVNGPLGNTSAAAAVHRSGGGGAGVSCDQCRERKVKCESLLQEGGEDTVASNDPRKRQATCAACARRQDTCTYEYTYRKPGRPKKARPLPSESHQRRSRSPTLGSGSTHAHSASPVVSHAPSQQSMYPNSVTFANLPASPVNASPFFPPAETFFGSARQALQVPAMAPLDYSMPVQGGYDANQFRVHDLGHGIVPNAEQANDLEHFLGSIGEMSQGYVGSSSAPAAATFGDTSSIPSVPSMSQYPLMSASEPIFSSSISVNGSTPSAAPRLDTAHSGHEKRSLGEKPGQIEEIASWGDVSYLISLHARFQHALVPMCHQPSFASDIMHRRDQGDEAFRCLLLSIVSYTICQCPLQSLLGRMNREQLEELLRRSQKASRIIQIRHQMKPNLLVLASTIIQATTSAELSNNLLSDVQRLVYGLNLHKDEPREGMSCMELEISRRVFWEAYVIDKTNALNGQRIFIHDADGTPPLPLELDDEMIPLDDRPPGSQRFGRLSYMVGFNVITKIFRWIYQCLWRQRVYKADRSASLSEEQILAWITDVNAAYKKLVGELPSTLNPNFASQSDSDLYGMQAANICITGLCLEFALLDLTATVCPQADTTTQRHHLARRVLADLENIPIQCLALNGESMRGKVLRVVLALLSMAHPSDELGGSAWDWWNFYSRVQFLQLMPAHSPPVVPTRPQSPG